MLSRRTALPFVDLTILLLAWIVLLVNPPKQAEAARPVADYVLFVVWDLGRDTDLDVYVQGPDRSTVWFRAKDAGYMSVDRDDLGNVRDSGPVNQEIVSFRAPLDGSYLVSVHTYNDRSGAGSGLVAFELQNRDGKSLWQAAFPLPAPNIEVGVVELTFRAGRFVRSYPSSALIRHGARRRP